ncbi:MAG: GNAT family N-acetyltransferase [Chloroflexi bacterium]|nr:GNAT family N-acetyltransferase [Chloroflexota bacterium]
MPSWTVSERIVPQPVIRRAHVHDLPRVVELLQQESLRGERREDLGPPLPQRYYDAFARIEADPRNDIMVAEMDGHVVGVFQITLIQHLMRAGELVAEIESVVVDEPFRGKKIGEAMMRWAIDDARRRGCSRVQLTSNAARKDAHRFYERLGFVRTSVGMKLVL